MQVVGQLALDEADPRVATLACWGLAAACHAQRHKKSNAGSVGGPNAGAQMRALIGLPEDGAMRALTQIVLTGCHSSSSCLLLLPDPKELLCLFFLLLFFIVPCLLPFSSAPLQHVPFSCLFTLLCLLSACRLCSIRNMGHAAAP